eukprot:CAMPEP_0204601070 /NCGR_PEP_ID=MMETSP0661-20131031/55808_1 /ASSEMBLY_ACC=CAM_ASM_000606 /TAXON_ID=109239 /ORGANISM="Alexandrium margalefi, Strain AMGDE01CS-322" /LENGTH=171 /DNA_ID=CAMNT_0051611913 /DNA_START=71 /DNA_END=586 /DNA_ORIENTATION=-
MGAGSSGGWCSVGSGIEVPVRSAVFAEEIPMQISSTTVLEDDRIDPWSVDLGLAAELPSKLVSLATCGGSTAPPQGYLADSQQGSIVLRSLREGPIFKGDVGYLSEGNLVMDLDPEDNLVMDLDPDAIDERQDEATVFERMLKEERARRHAAVTHHLASSWRPTSPPPIAH